MDMNKTDFLALVTFWSRFKDFMDRKIARAKQFILTKNQFYHAHQPREGILELHSCCGLIFMAVFGNFDQLLLTH